MAQRRDFLKTLGLGSSSLVLGGASFDIVGAALSQEVRNPSAERLYEEWLNSTGCL